MTTAEKSTSAKQIIEQKRARHALENVYVVAKNYPKGSDDRKSFVSCVENLPAAILNNGLGQAVATLLAKAKGEINTPEYIIYNILEEWLCRDDSTAPYNRTRDNTKNLLMNCIVNGSRSSYIKAQIEALSYLEWLKKFTVAFLKEPDKKEKDKKGD